MPRLTREAKLPAIRAVQAWFLSTRDEEVGELAAGLLLDALEPTLGRLYYNEAIHDARAIVAGRMAALDEDLFALERLPETR